MQRDSLPTSAQCAPGKSPQSPSSAHGRHSRSNAGTHAPVDERAKPGHHVLPGFGLSMGFTVLYLSLVVLIPLSTLFFRSTTQGWSHFVEVISSPRVVASYRLSFGASLIGAMINAVFDLPWRRGRWWTFNSAIRAPRS